MRIGLITPGFSASPTDWCIPALLDLVRRLSAGHDVRVLALRYPHRRDPYRVEAAAVQPLGAGQRGGLARFPLLVRAIGWLTRQGRQRPFDVLHALWSHEPGFVATVAARRLGAPSLVSLMGGELTKLPEIRYGGQLSPVNRRLTAFALSRATEITVGSTHMYDLAASRIGRERLSLAPLGVDLDRFLPTGDEVVSLAGSPAILHVASLVPVKDQATLLRAFALVSEHEPAARLHLVGEGPLRGELASLGERLGLAERVIFHGGVDHGALPDYYRGADLCVISSRFESQCMVALEAAACGRLTVGTEVGVLPELAGPGRAVAPGDAGALARALHDAIRHPDLPGEAARCRMEVARRFSLAATVPALERIYRRLVDA